MDDAFVYEGDASGVRRWAQEMGWVAPSKQPPVVAEILQGAPVPTGSEYAVTDVVTGIAHGWDALAFNIGMKSSQGVAPKWAVTAIGRAQQGGGFWLHPRRLGRFRLRGRDVGDVSFANSELAERWSFRLEEPVDLSDSFIVSPQVRDALLSSDDGDEVWGTTTAIAALRADGHRPALLVHHLQLLACVAEADADRPSSR